MPAAFEGEPLEIGFNPEFLKEGIESVEGEEVVLRLISPLRPGPAAAGRQRRLPLPGDADPPQRLRSAGARHRRRSEAAAKPRGRLRVELAAGIVSLVGPNGAGKTNFLEALYFGLTGRSFRTSDRRDLIPFGADLARAEAVVQRRGRDRATSARLGQPQRGPPPPARRQSRRPGDAGPQPPAGCGLLPGSADPGQGPAGRAPRPSRSASSPPAGPRGRSCARRYGQALAQRNALLARLAARLGARGRARRLGRSARRGRRRR